MSAGLDTTVSQIKSRFGGLAQQLVRLLYTIDAAVQWANDTGQAGTEALYGNTPDNTALWSFVAVLMALADYATYSVAGASTLIDGTAQGYTPQTVTVAVGEVAVVVPSDARLQALLRGLNTDHGPVIRALLDGNPTF